MGYLEKPKMKRDREFVICNARKNSDGFHVVTVVADYWALSKIKNLYYVLRATKSSSGNQVDATFDPRYNANEAKEALRKFLEKETHNAPPYS
jgi:hypothetical protein